MLLTAYTRTEAKPTYQFIGPFIQSLQIVCDVTHTHMHIHQRNNSQKDTVTYRAAPHHSCKCTVADRYRVQLLPASFADNPWLTTCIEQKLGKHFCDRGIIPTSLLPTVVEQKKTYINLIIPQCIVLQPMADSTHLHREQKYFDT